MQNNSKMEIGQENFIRHQRSIWVWSRTDLSGNLDFEAISRRTRVLKANLGRLNPL